MELGRYLDLRPLSGERHEIVTGSLRLACYIYALYL